MIRVTYLDHSGFAVTSTGAANGDVIMVFDYSADPSHALEHLLDSKPEADVVFFVSHRHSDHYNKSIFEMAQNHRRTYVVSNDVPARGIPSTLAVAGMSPGDTVDSLPGGIVVKAYDSTDAGVSFLLTLTDGTRIFHAGDLNDWHWRDESTPREVEKAEHDFRVIVNRIASEADSIDVVMFPVDSRLGSDYARGANIFLKTIRTGTFIPMHFGADWKEACDFGAYNPNPATRCECLHTPGKSIEIG